MANKPKRQELWIDAQRRCGLSDEAVRMAKELGLNPRSLIKNIPSSKQQWKAPVEEWVREMYAKRHPPARSGSSDHHPAQKLAPLEP